MTKESNRPHENVPVTLIANPYSVHVWRWLKLFRLAGMAVRIETAERSQEGAAPDVPVEFLAPEGSAGPMVFRYLWAGWKASRKRRDRGEVLHAHCASGSGLTAWLSRRPYVVTTYGSEVFGAADRGRLYHAMIRRVLQRATLVTATTPRMTQTLQQEFGVPAQRIRTFSLGYDSDVFTPVDDEARGSLKREFALPADESLWVVNRRSLPLYRTVEVVSGFLRYCEGAPRGRLVVLSGNDDAAYSRQVRDVIAASSRGSRVRLISEFLSADGVARWLQAADFAISVPRTDQLSTSILEAMACGAVPVLSDLEAYRPLHACPSIRRVSDVTSGGFSRMFAETAALPLGDLRRQQQMCADFVGTHYSEAGILDDVRDLFGLPPLPQASIANAA